MRRPTFTGMRHIFCLCLLLLFHYGLKAGAVITGNVKTKTPHLHAQAAVRKFIQFPGLWQNRKPEAPEKLIIIPGNHVISPLKTDDYDGTGAFREYFPDSITSFTCKVQAARLLPDLHAIIRSLIFPQHIFW